jgi:hypothetical protein
MRAELAQASVPKRKRSPQLAQLAKAQLEVHEVHAAQPGAAALAAIPVAKPNVYGFGRRMRLTVEPNPTESPVLFIRYDGPGFCYIGCRVPIDHVAAVSKTRPRRVTSVTGAPPLDVDVDVAESLSSESAAPSSAKRAKVEVAEVTEVTEVTEVQSAAAHADTPFVRVRVVVLTKQDEDDCLMAARAAEQTERSHLLGKVAKLLELLDAMGNAPIAIVASADAHRAIGCACPTLRSGANQSVQHFEVPAGLPNPAHPADPSGFGGPADSAGTVDIDATAAFIIAKVRGMPCLNPTGNPNLTVRLAFAYVSEYNSRAAQQIIMPEYVNGISPYPMLNYKYLRNDPEAVHDALAGLVCGTQTSPTSPPTSVVGLGALVNTSEPSEPTIIWLNCDSE